MMTADTSLKPLRANLFEAATVAHAQVAVAKAKILTTKIAIETTNTLFALGGTASTDLNLALDRYWRNTWTHTLHDLVRWKYAVVGDYYLNGRNPPPSSVELIRP